MKHEHRTAALHETALIEGTVPVSEALRPIPAEIDRAWITRREAESDNEMAIRQKRQVPR